MKHGFFRVAAASPLVTVADTTANTARIIDLAHQAYEAGADAVVLPEMSITAYTCADLFHNETLLQGARKGISEIAEASRALPGLLIMVGAPLRKT